MHDDGGVVSRFFFHAAYPILKLGSQRPLQETDLPDLHERDTVCYNRAKIENLWDIEVKSGQKNLARALFAEYIKSTWKAQFFAFVNLVARAGQAWALGMLMEQFGKFDSGDGSSTSSNEKVHDAKMGYVYAGLLVFCGFITFPSKQHLFFQGYRKGLQLKTGLIATIYHKTLRLPSVGIDVSNGHVTNLASNDVDRFQQTSVPAVFIFVGPIASVVILCVGLFVTGPAFGVGFSLLLLLLPIQMYTGRQFAKYRSRVAALTDERNTLVSQVVIGNRVMKFECWEDSFREKILHIRQQETNILYRASVFKAFNEALFYFSSLMVSVFAFTIDVSIFGNHLSPKTVFTSLILFNMLQYILAKHIPNAITGLSECFISCRRIQAFLELPEYSGQELKVTNTKQSSNSSRELISLSHVYCHWTRRKDVSSQPAISDVSLSFHSGKLYCVIGVVGSGKSALLATLSAELPVSEGKIERKYSSLSFAVQENWIMDGTVRENILMGKEYDETWYTTVYQACGLNEDFSSVGDKQILGDRGVQISGGQRARIGLARALYCDSDILLLDDCLSAVDSKIARSLFYSAIQKLATKRGRCVVLATHQLQFCDDADCCIFLDRGKVIGVGSYGECLALSDGKLLHTVQTEEQGPVDETLGAEYPDHSLMSPIENDKAVADEQMQKEERTTGVIRMKTWIAYANAVGILVSVALLILFSVTQAGQLVAIVILGQWSETSVDEQASFISTVLWLTCVVIFLSIARAQLTFYSLIKASKHLHNNMLSTVLRAKIEFFDTNPLGRILNRFSSDVGTCDETLPLTIYDFSVGLFVVAGSIVTAVISLPFTMVALIPLLLIFIRLRKLFVTTTRELKRIDGLLRSPIYVMMSESLKGIRTIRCNNKISYLSNMFEKNQTAYVKAAFVFIYCSRYFAMNLDIISFLFTSVAAFSAVLFHNHGWLEIQPSVLGLALTLLIQISTTNFPWVVRQSAEVANQMVSVERIHEYTQLPSEAPFTLDDDIDENWPANASIKAKDLSVRYRSTLPVCLDGLSFTIEAAERVGVVGRTGSGKSSLVQAMLRLLEAETGYIEVDGTDISSIGLRRLRESIAVIPQSPVLFGRCTIRDNLDPFHRYGDDAIWDALKSVQIDKVVGSLPLKLDTAVAEGGQNFSVGQRQLLCLARAVLLRSNIIILDEPSASVDSKTDQLLQTTLRERFSGATIISIAHRLDTVIEYDKIMLLSDGRILEYGSPSDLLSHEHGHFLSLVKSTGETMSKSLIRRARTRDSAHV